MFLDPEPRRHPSRTRSPSRTPSPTKSYRNQHSTERKPLQERSRSQINSWEHGSVSRDPSRGRKSQKPTVRLVKQTPSVPASIADSDVAVEDLKTAVEFTIRKYERAQLPAPPLTGMAGDPGSKQEYGKASEYESMASVSRPTSPAHQPRKLMLPASVTLLPKSSNHIVPKSAWHRRNGSSGNYSNASTLRDIDTSIAQSSRPSERLSQGTTLRGTPTPTPTEQEHRERFDRDNLVQEGPAHTLETLAETSPERSTIRAVPDSDTSSIAEQQQLDKGLVDPTILQRCYSPTDSESSLVYPRESYPSQSQAPSSPSASYVDLKDLSSHGPRYRPSLQSLTESEVSLHRPSSPILVVYESDSSVRPRLVDHSPSIDSIQSRLDNSNWVRPDTGNSLAHSSSGPSLRPASSIDTLPPLRIPKKRLRRTRPSTSMASSSGESEPSQMDYDTRPFPRQQFSGHLSTIASESDRTGSQHLSSFSLGSGVWTGDEASAYQASATYRGASGPDSYSSPPAQTRSQPQSPDLCATSSEGEPGDMTLDIYRDESAKPLPLFKKQPPFAHVESKKYTGPLPPMPPIPRSSDSDENFDVVSELQAPVLRQQRSGYSLRKRSNSSPNRSRGISQVSYISSDRASITSSGFPIWAKYFYSGTIDLSSAVSLIPSSPARPRKALPYHVRQESQMTEASIASRLGTGYTTVSNSTGSTPSSRFLPSIFRPRTRSRSSPGATRHFSTRWRNRKSQASVSTEVTNRPDSMIITADSHPLPTLPSTPNDELVRPPPEHVERVEVKDSVPRAQRESHPQYQRKYSKQKQWNQMEFPRPMSKDQVPAQYYFDDGALPPFPHLAPSKRATQQTGSMFRPPSFAESLDKFITSRVNRQITLFVLGFLCPLFWMLAAVLPLPHRPLSTPDVEKSAMSVEDVQAAVTSHVPADTARMWWEEREWRKARWWRGLNRIMSVVGLGVIGALITLAVLATR